LKYYEDIEVGADVDFPGRYHVTQENIVAVGREWDPFPFHTDPEAARDSAFGGLVASTVHLFAITVKLGHSATDLIAAVSSLGIDEFRNLAPAYAGDVLRMRCTYLDKRRSKSRPGTGITRSSCELINQDDKVLLRYISTALVETRGD